MCQESALPDLNVREVGSKALDGLGHTTQGWQEASNDTIPSYYRVKYLLMLLDQIWSAEWRTEMVRDSDASSLMQSMMTQLFMYTIFLCVFMA